MARSSDNVARRYFEALAAHDLDAAVACWRPGGVDRLVASQDLIAPEGIRRYFAELFAAFPDSSFEGLQELGDGPHTTIPHDDPLACPGRPSCRAISSGSSAAAFPRRR